MNQVTTEAQDWVDLAVSSGQLPDEERESFVKHVKLFGEHFLKYDPEIHCRDSKHNDKSDDTTPPADFFHRW